MKKVLVFIFGLIFTPLIIFGATQLPVLPDKISFPQSEYSKTLKSTSISCNDYEVNNGTYVFKDSKRKSKVQGFMCDGASDNIYNYQKIDITKMSSSIKNNIKMFFLYFDSKKSTSSDFYIDIIGLDTFVGNSSNLYHMSLSKVLLNDTSMFKNINFSKGPSYGVGPDTSFLALTNSKIMDTNFIDNINNNYSLIVLVLRNIIVNNCHYEQLYFDGYHTPKPWVLPSC